MRFALGAVLVLTVACATTKDAEKDESPAKSGKTLSGSAVGNAQAEAQRIAMASAAASQAANAKCQPLEKREIPWAEEHLVGTWLATARLNGNKLAEADNARVATIGKWLAHKSSRPDLPWTFGVIENQTSNAFSTPGGYVFVTTGLLSRMKNEAELAGVLAHEIGHVSAQHPLRRYRDGLFKQCVAANMVAELARAGVAPSQSQQQFIAFAERFANLDLEAVDVSFTRWLLDTVVMLQMAGVGRDAEFEADRLAEEMLVFSGYDASQFESFLAANADAFPNKPPAADRVAKLKALREGELAPFATATAAPALTK